MEYRGRSRGRGRAYVPRGTRGGRGRDYAPRGRYIQRGDSKSYPRHSDSRSRHRRRSYARSRSRSYSSSGSYSGSSYDSSRRRRSSRRRLQHSKDASDRSRRRNSRDKRRHHRRRSSSYSGSSSAYSRSRSPKHKKSQRAPLIKERPYIAPTQPSQMLMPNQPVKMTFASKSIDYAHGGKSVQPPAPTEPLTIDLLDSPEPKVVPDMDEDMNLSSVRYSDTHEKSVSLLKDLKSENKKRKPITCIQSDEDTEFYEKKMKPIPETPPPSTPPLPPVEPPAAKPSKPSTTIHDILSSIGINLKDNAAFSQGEPDQQTLPLDDGNNGAADTSEYTMRGRQYRSDMMAAYQNGSTPPHPFDATEAQDAPAAISPDDGAYVRPKKNRRGPFADRGLPSSMVSNQSPSVANGATRAAPPVSAPVSGGGTAVVREREQSRHSQYPPSGPNNTLPPPHHEKSTDQRTMHRNQTNPQQQHMHREPQQTSGINNGYDRPPTQRSSAYARDSTIDEGDAHQALDDLFAAKSGDLKRHINSAVNAANLRHQQPERQPANLRTTTTTHNQFIDSSQNSAAYLNPANASSSAGHIPPIQQAAKPPASANNMSGTMEEIATKCGFNPAMLNFLKLAQSNGMFATPGSSETPPQVPPQAPSQAPPPAGAPTQPTRNNQASHAQSRTGLQGMSSSAGDSGMNSAYSEGQNSRGDARRDSNTHPAKLPPGAAINPNAMGYNAARSEAHLERYMNSSVDGNVQGGGAGAVRGQSASGAMNFNQQRHLTNPAQNPHPHQADPLVDDPLAGEDISDIFSQFIRKSPLRTDQIEAFNPSPPPQPTVPLASSLQQPLQTTTSSNLPSGLSRLPHASLEKVRGSSQPLTELAPVKTIRVVPGNQQRSPSINEQISKEVKDSRRIEECKRNLKSLEYCTSLLVEKRKKHFDLENCSKTNKLHIDRVNRSKASIIMTTNEIKENVSKLRDMGISQGLIAKHIVKKGNKSTTSKNQYPVQVKESSSKKLKPLSSPSCSSSSNSSSESDSNDKLEANKNERQNEKPKPQSNSGWTTVSEPSRTEKNHEEHVDYIDRGCHWCKRCNMEFNSIKKFFDHFNRPMHQKLPSLDDRSYPWINKSMFPSNKQISKHSLKKNIKGCDKIIGIYSFYCEICKEFFGGSVHAIDHMSSVQHNVMFEKYTQDNPRYERNMSSKKIEEFNKRLNKTSAGKYDSKISSNRQSDEEEHTPDIKLIQNKASKVAKNIAARKSLSHSQLQTSLEENINDKIRKQIENIKTNFNRNLKPSSDHFPKPTDKGNFARKPSKLDEAVKKQNEIQNKMKESSDTKIKPIGFQIKNQTKLKQLDKPKDMKSDNDTKKVDKDTKKVDKDTKKVDKDTKKVDKDIKKVDKDTFNKKTDSEAMSECSLGSFDSDFEILEEVESSKNK